jgi:hypothetical protein
MDDYWSGNFEKNDMLVDINLENGHSRNSYLDIEFLEAKHPQ